MARMLYDKSPYRVSYTTLRHPKGQVPLVAGWVVANALQVW